MTLEDKISLCNGADFWHSKAMAQYGIPAVTMSDGPHGVRCQKTAPICWASTSPSLPPASPPP